MRRSSTSDRTLNPAKAGELFGKFTPSKCGRITITVDGKRKRIRANRKERRRIAHGKD